MNQNKGKSLISTSQLAEILGISRVAVFKKIKAGVIPAEKIGRNYVIRRADIPEAVKGVLTRQKRGDIEAAVKKATEEYGETLRLLGKE